MHYSQFPRHKFCLILTETTTEWSKNFQAEIKRQNSQNSQSEPNQTRLIYFTVCLLDRGTAMWNVERGIPNTCTTQNITSLNTHQEINIVNRMSRTLN